MQLSNLRDFALTVLTTIAAHPFLTIAVLVPTYILIIVTYRLLLHPIAHFPGPKLAAATFLYEFYCNAVLDGQYINQIARWHACYGPIIRISPDEIHVNDPAFIPELMPTGGKNVRRNKYPRLIQLFGFSQAAGATADHDLHRHRRGGMAKMFSKDAVRRVEPIMREVWGVLRERLVSEFAGSDKVLDVLPMFGAITNDVISQYAYGFNSEWVRAPMFNKVFFEMLDGFHVYGPWALQFKWFMPMLFSLPKWVLLKMNPGFETFVRFKMQLLNNINVVMKRHGDVKGRATIFDEILESKLSDDDKRPLRLLQEAQNVSIAGTETTSWILSIMTYHLLSSPQILSHLRRELETAIPDPVHPPPLSDIEQLPYLTAVINEGFRLAMGTSQRQTRINPDGPMIYHDGNKEWRIPSGTPAAISAPSLHLSPTLFSSPLNFEPSRFLENPGLKAHLLTFSQGSRQCIGKQLATSEIYMIMSELWRNFGSRENHGEDGWWELWETEAEDVAFARDRFVPYPRRESRGIRVKVCRVKS